MRWARIGRRIAAIFVLGLAAPGACEVVPDTPLGVAEGMTGVAITSHSAYWASVFGIGVAEGGSAAQPGLLVIRGEVHNQTKGALRHVKFVFELLDGRGRVVTSEYGYNRSAEMLRAIDSPIPWDAHDPPQLPIPTGDSDTFRMLFLRNETPPFQSYRIRVLEAESSDVQ